MKHCATAYRKGLCHCDTCTDDHRRRSIEERTRRRAQRVIMNGRLIVVNPNVTHGKYTTYVNWGCQCEACSTANAVHSAQTRERHKVNRLVQ